MARAYRGPYARPSSYTVPYETAGVWGTGINDVHEQYGEGPPLRVMGREDTQGSSPVGDEHAQGREYQQPAESNGDNVPSEMTWGYPVDYDTDSFGAGADGSPWMVAPAVTINMGDRPAWNEDPSTDTLRSTSTMSPWNVSGTLFRARRAGARIRRVNRAQGGVGPEPITDPPSLQSPNETVTEGWRNKVTSFVAYAHPSSPRQYEIQTSMVQRFLSRNNDRAVSRGTDEARSTIASRVMPMVRKQYSQGERLYDMAPYQIDQMDRAFRYRTAGTGRADWMNANAVYPVSPIQRVPPPDASLGVPEVQQSEDYGYTGEDTMYYA
jgi:hypothetical protein